MGDSMAGAGAAGGSPQASQGVPSTTEALAGGTGESLDVEESFGVGLSQQVVRMMCQEVRGARHFSLP